MATRRSRVSDVDYDVVVVGAGYAGVASARDLRDRGLSVLLLEGSNRVGGRRFTRPFKGRPDIMIECGGEYVGLETHVNVRREVERYNIPLRTSDPDHAPETVRFFTGGELRTMPVPVADLWAFEAVAVRMH
jgi:monoamine oxidase